MTRSRWFMVFVGLFVTALGVAWAKGDWSSARSKAEEMKSKQMELRKLTPGEIKRVVTAICEAEEEDRKQAGRDAADRVASLVKNELSNLERVRDDAYKQIDEVIADPDLKSNHDDAKKLRDDVAERWKSIENMAKNAMRGGNLPVVSYLSSKGIEEHQNYQRNSSNCHAYEFPTGSRIADCLYAGGDTCYVIELKPNNSRAISRGNRQAQDSVDDLDKELRKGDKSDVMKDLIKKNSDFAKCKEWRRRLKCYTLCPDINEDGEHRQPNVSWSDCS